MSLVLDRFYYGVCYYPEAWDEKRHASDIDRIADAGFNYIRMGEGAWSYWEPQEGQYQFDQFDRVIDLCRKRKLKVILGTPTYTGPAWIAANYPDVLRWNFNRIPMKHGSRRFYNYTSPKYLELSDRIVTALAGHYRDNDTVFAWQLDNEFNCHMSVSYAPSDVIAFRAWLRRKYKSIDRLNDAWGTRFWSQTYDDWDQIDLPHPTAAPPNPSQLLDESRFISDTVVSFASRQAEILRKANRRWLITHNGLFDNIDGPKLAEQLDFFSHDQYPLFSAEGDWPAFGWPLAQARGFSFPYGILEQQSGPGGQLDYLHRTPRPGQLRLWAWQSILHGAKLLSYFRWRTCPYGAEQHWHGLLDADDRDTPRLEEAKQLGAELKQLPRELFDAPVVKSVAILREFDNDVNERRINTYTRSGSGEFARWYDALARQHIPVDLLWTAADLRGYGMVVAPHLKMFDAALIRKLDAFVRAGGSLILGAQSGLKNRNGHVVGQTPPGLLRSLAGVEVEEWTTLNSGESRSARLLDGASIDLVSFVERLRPRGAEVVASWATPDPLLPPGSAAITLNHVGRGLVLYIGGYLPTPAIRQLVMTLMPRLKLRPLVGASDDIEVIARTTRPQSTVALLNHGQSPQRVVGLPPKGRDLISKNAVSGGEITLPPYGVAIIAPAGAEGSSNRSRRRK